MTVLFEHRSAGALRAKETGPEIESFVSAVSNDSILTYASVKGYHNPIDLRWRKESVMSPEEWITTREAAERLGVTTARIRQMVAEDQIDARKMGSKYRGQWQINANEVEERIHAKGVTETIASRTE